MTDSIAFSIFNTESLAIHNECTLFFKNKLMFLKSRYLNGFVESSLLIKSIIFAPVNQSLLTATFNSLTTKATETYNIPKMGFPFSMGVFSPAAIVVDKPTELNLKNG